MDEQFANLDAWSTCDDQEFWTTILRAANVSLIEGGGVRLVASEVAEESGLFPGGQIYTNATYLYGFIESRCKVAEGRQGTWSCTWMHSHSPPEEYADANIDIVEYFGGVAKYLCGSWIDHVKEEYEPEGLDDLPSGYHYFAVEWKADEIIFFYDDRAFHVNTDKIPSVPLRILLWNGVTYGPTPPESWPNQYDVDYVRVWQRAA